MAERLNYRPSGENKRKIRLAFALAAGGAGLLAASVVGCKNEESSSQSYTIETPEDLLLTQEALDRVVFADEALVPVVTEQSTVPTLPTLQADQEIKISKATHQKPDCRLKNVKEIKLQLPSKRTEKDRPDDWRGKACTQIHVVYAIPADGVDERLDTNGSIETSVNAANKWFENQAEGKSLRFDTRKGSLDITFVRLKNKESEPSFNLEQELSALGFSRPNKIYIVYYGGSNNLTECGFAFRPPLFTEERKAFLLLGAKIAGVIPCNKNPLAKSEDAPSFWEFALLHETLHTLGFVAECAPHTEPGGGHVFDDGRDLMFPSLGPGEHNLDSANDDYFRHGIPGCPDLEKSTFLEPPVPDAKLPPGWQPLKK